MTSIRFYRYSAMRLASLDIFRGLTVAGMIFVNTVSLAGLADWAKDGKIDAKNWLVQLYLWIDHSPWHGSWNLADFVFPFFLYIIGLAMAYSFAKYNDENRPTKDVYLKIIRRTVILFAIGLLINGLVYRFCAMPQGIYKFDTLRIMGVLQRIALAYGAASILTLVLPKKAQWATAGGILVGYWLLLAFVPSPDAPAGYFTKTPAIAAFFDDPKYNIASYIDRLIIPAQHLYAGGAEGYDPEGIVSTIPAIASVLLGYFNGVWLKQRRSARTDNSVQMAMFGLAAIVAGRVWGGFFPINKSLNTSSFVLFMAGWALLVFALCYELVDVRGWGRKLMKPFEWLGLNAIFAFVGSVFMLKFMNKNFMEGCVTKGTKVYGYLAESLFGWAGAANSVVLFSLLAVLLWTFICFWMYRLRWFIKI
jgi:predicted acyltransferase